jgi:hypothetical protein
MAAPFQDEGGRSSSHIIGWAYSGQCQEGKDHTEDCSTVQLWAERYPYLIWLLEELPVRGWHLLKREKALSRWRGWKVEGRSSADG